MCWKTILVSSLVLLALDAVFLYVMSGKFSSLIFDVQRSPIQLNPVGAGLCYLILIFGLYHFILEPNKPILDAFLLGVVVYGVYETTSYAVLKKWKLSTVVMDTLWGGVLFASTTYLTRLFTK